MYSLDWEMTIYKITGLRVQSVRLLIIFRALTHLMRLYILLEYLLLPLGLTITPQQQPAQQQQLAPPQQQQTTFLSPPPQISPPDPISELRRIGESLALKVDKLTQNMGSPPQNYPIHYVRT